jgi:uncharacterized protein YbjQ (UPF0145 family)
MIVTTTTAIDGRPVVEYMGVVTGEAVLVANVFRDLFAGLCDIVGGRSAGYARSLREATTRRRTADRLPGRKAGRHRKAGRVCRRRPAGKDGRG